MRDKMLVNLFCPVEMIDYKLYESKTNGQIYCELAFNNLSHKVVKGLKLMIYSYDQFGDLISEEKNGFVCKIEFKDGLKFLEKQTTDKKISLTNLSNTRKIEVDILKILYEDNSLWSKGTSESERVELSQIKNKQLLEFIQTRDGKEARNLSREIDDKWVCVCGRLNLLNHFECKRCGRFQDYVLTEYSNEDTIIHNFNKFLEQKAEEKKQIQEGLRLQQDIEKQKNKKRYKIVFYITFLLLVTGCSLWALADRFKFSTVDNQRPIEINENSVALESVKDGVIDTSFEIYEGNNKDGDFTIRYYSNGALKEKVIRDISRPRLIDIDNDGTEEILVSKEIITSKLDNAQIVIWDDIYEFDIETEDLVFVSSKYPEYYEKYYIPSIKGLSNLSNDYDEKQAFSVVIQAASDLINGKFIPDKDQKEIQKKFETLEVDNPLQITKQGDTYYIHGITYGMKINEAIEKLGEPDESFEVNSKVVKWYLDKNLVLSAEYYTDTISYMDLGEFSQEILEQSMILLGNPSKKNKSQFYYFTSSQLLKLHVMKPGKYRVQLMDSEIPD
ncbi:hypothetical protein RE628_08075 [Paenibacillus sp. D2_2]|uniref:hypothetical protein n=1 Tax=Paenibacillus sp. D2_2 TaxID=3073092 RepID=UPI00281661B4|nr:hypothetical protein [Paenibacillus sp. D2_2]WMT42336.1 hypothetical protein RE628_08075 [Paenibacillus sp. D2_2]